MNRFWKTFLYGTSMLAFSHAASAQPVEQTCQEIDRNGTVVLMFCPSPLGEKTWIEAAKQACGLNRQCNVWIWDDKSKMPVSAPKTDAELSKKHTGFAVAIWVNDSQSLIKLKRAR